MEKLASIPGLKDIGLTTNGILLGPMAQALRDAGLERINISLDTMDAAKFERLTRRTGFEQVIEGILAAKEAGFDPIKINAVAMRGVTEDDVVPLGRFARTHDLELRFIEYMPLDAGHLWEREKVLFAADILDLLDRGIGPLVPTADQDPRAPALSYEYADGGGRVGFIASISRPFCLSCNRIRLTSDGKLAQLPFFARRNRCTAAPARRRDCYRNLPGHSRLCQLKMGRTRNQYGPVHPARAFDALDRRVIAVLVDSVAVEVSVASITRSPRICSLDSLRRRAVHKSWLYSSLELERVASNRSGR